MYITISAHLHHAICITVLKIAPASINQKKQRRRVSNTMGYAWHPKCSQWVEGPGILWTWIEKTDVNKDFISNIMAIAQKTSREMSNACASPFSVFSESHVTNKTAGSFLFFSFFFLNLNRLPRTSKLTVLRPGGCRTAIRHVGSTWWAWHSSGDTGLV